DNLFDRALALKAVPVEEGDDADLLYDRAVEDLRAWLGRLEDPVHLESFPLEVGEPVDYATNRSRDDFEDAVRRVREYIRAGDAYQVVVSQRLAARLPASPLRVYRALRTLNPSPYLYLLELDGTRLIGSSPELLVRVEDRRVTVRPIAGTRRRGATEEEDRELETELLEDEKERAEHLMLVDLGRNDVGAVAEPGSVEIPEFMTVETYSHVIHMVSQITGVLDEGRDVLDAFRSCFPAGTLTGAPKVRAMEIIDELEPTRRGPYGGAAGYVAYGGRSLDMAIAIRTILEVDATVYVQAGAGIVHDSVPEREWQETLSKAEALLEALAMAGSP
ncbi:MAG: anthranilate synthase component I family protein, partial [Gemmatimonadota bacterium]